MDHERQKNTANPEGKAKDNLTNEFTAVAKDSQAVGHGIVPIRVKTSGRQRVYGNNLKELSWRHTCKQKVTVPTRIYSGRDP